MRAVLQLSRLSFPSQVLLLRAKLHSLHSVLSSIFGIYRLVCKCVGERMFFMLSNLLSFFLISLNRCFYCVFFFFFFFPCKDSLHQRPWAPSEDWLVIVSTDHGGMKKGHGSCLPSNRHIFIIAEGVDFEGKGTLEPRDRMTNEIEFI